MAASELEVRPTPEQGVQERDTQIQGLVERPETAEVAAELGQFVQPSTPPPVAQVTDASGQTLLAPAGTQVPTDQPPYTLDEIKEDQKAPVTSGRHWLGVLKELLLLRFLFKKAGASLD